MEFVAAKFIFCSTFYLVCKDWKYKFMQYLEQIQGHVHTQIQQACGKNKLILEMYGLYYPSNEMNIFHYPNNQMLFIKLVKKLKQILHLI